MGERKLKTYLFQIEIMEIRQKYVKHYKPF